MVFDGRGEVVQIGCQNATIGLDRYDTVPLRDVWNCRWTLRRSEKEEDQVLPAETQREANAGTRDPRIRARRQLVIANAPCLPISTSFPVDECFDEM